MDGNSNIDMSLIADMDKKSTQLIMFIVYDIKFLGMFVMHLCNKEISSLWPRHID